MPLPADEQVLATSKGLVDTLHGIFGPHPGFRPGETAALAWTTCSRQDG